jgi:hypothetical protein
MSIRIPRRTLVITLVGLFALYLLFGWLALPRIIQYQSEKYIAEKTGRNLVLDRPEFNPFTLDLRIANLKLSEQDGKPLFSFRNLDVDLSITSLFRRALVFDLISFDGPESNVILRRDNKLNWSLLMDAFKGNDKLAKADSQNALPRLFIQRFVLSDGRLDFSDDNTGFSTRLEPLALELRDISTLPDDQGSYKIDAHTATGSHILWQGRMTLAPLEIKGTLDVDGVDLVQLAPYLKDLLPMAPPAGVLSLSTDYRVAYEASRFGLTLDNAKAKVSDLRVGLTKNPGRSLAIDTIEISKTHFDLNSSMLVLGTLSVKGSEITAPGTRTPMKPVRVGELVLDDLRINMSKRDLKLARVALSDGDLKIVRYAGGRLSVVDILHTVLPASPAKQKGHRVDQVEPWHYRIDKFELRGFSAGFRDETVTPTADMMVEDISLDVESISDNLANPLPLEASLRSRDGGSLTVSGRIVPSLPSADLRVKLAGLTLKPVQPYLASVANLTLAGGQLNIEGRASYGKRGGKFKGGFALRNLRLLEAETKDTFLAWKSMASRNLEASQESLNITELGVDGLECKLVIDKDKSVNLTRILHKTEASPEVPNNVPRKTLPVKSKENAPAFLVNIDRLKISNGAMNYADYSLVLPFGTSIHDLKGAIVGVSSLPGTEGQIELDGQVDDYGVARALGQINLFNPTDDTDVKVIFSNVEMVRLTPYSSTFAGRKIVSGKLSLDLEYKIKNRQLEGANQIVMDKLTLGDRVESSTAVSLPLDLAIAILEDSDNRIDLGLPVSGSLDDPQFSYGSIIWKAFLNVIGKIATAPFRALGTLFGGGEKFESIAFEFGKPDLSPPEREKLVHLATALNKRPKLSLTVYGVYADADRVALQDLVVRRTVAKMTGQHLEADEDTGPLSTGSTKVQGALEKLYSERIGSSDLAALKEGYRKANPGMLQEGVGGKMMSLLSGLFQEKRTLNEDEVKQLKGTDFYAILFQRLRDREAITDVQLQELARTRGNNTLAALQAAGLPPERMQIAAPEKVEAKENDVPLKLELCTTSKSAIPATN